MEEQKDRGMRKKREGVVVSNKMTKTIVVNVVRKKLHPKYKKVFKISKKYKAHDEKNECQIGDKVIITETKPISKDKCWRLVEIVSKKS